MRKKNTLTGTEKLEQVAELKRIANTYFAALKSDEITEEEKREIRFDIEQITDQIISIVEAPERD